MQSKNNSDNLLQKQITGNLQKDIALLQTLFTNDDTLRIRRICNTANPALNCALLFFDGMINMQVVNEFIVKPISQSPYRADKDHIEELLKTKIIQTEQVETTAEIQKISQAMLYGDSILFVDGLKNAFIISSKGWEKRSVMEPPSEQVFRGPREGFTEAIMTNTSLLRRKVQNPDLKFKFLNLGTETHTKVCISYIENLAKPELIDEVEDRLRAIQLDSILDSNYIQEMIKDAPHSPFKTIYNSERPDTVAANLLEGRVAIMVDGSPSALTMPAFFIENFQASDDYYINYYFSTISRILRLIGFFITISAPAIYLALVTYHQEVIPTQLLLSLAAARQGVPFPTIIEELLLLIAFEVLREAGTRMPNNIGQALSIVGAVVLGQAAVEARFVSAPIVIIISITGITSLMIPRMQGFIVFTRLSLIILASIIGIYGYLFGMSLILLHLVSIRSFGYYYVGGFASFTAERQKDIVVRAPWWKMRNRPDYLAQVRQRQPERSRP